MKKYIKPEVKITCLNNDDVILVSGTLNVASFNKTNKGYTSINF